MDLLRDGRYRMGDPLQRSPRFVPEREKARPWHASVKKSLIAFYSFCNSVHLVAVARGKDRVFPATILSAPAALVIASLGLVEERLVVLDLVELLLPRRPLDRSHHRDQKVGRVAREQLERLLHTGTHQGNTHTRRLESASVVSREQHGDQKGEAYARVEMEEVVRQRGLSAERVRVEAWPKHHGDVVGRRAKLMATTQGV